MDIFLLAPTHSVGFWRISPGKMLLIRNKLGFPTQLLGKKMQVASPMVILHIKLLKHFPIQNGRGSGSSSMCSSNCCAPAHMDFRDLSICHENENPYILQPSHLFPNFHFPFWSTQLPVLIAVSIFGPTPSYIVEPGYDRCKATKFQEQVVTDL